MLEFKSAWMNAAGSLGFTPDSRNLFTTEKFGAFITNPISLRPRKAANGSRMLRHAGSVLLHSGLPNPGLSNTLRRYAEKWHRAVIPIIPHLIAEQTEEIRKAVSRLEELDNITAIELGLDHRVDRTLAADLVRAAQGELPMIVRVPLQRCMELAAGLIETGAAAISLGPASGTLPTGLGNFNHGLVYSPAVYPQALAVIEGLTAAGIPTIGAGGIASRAEGEAMLAVGAMAVQVDLALWKGEYLLGLD
jgi:dihydroorotate dehydrogenase (NAD+) catalytic subunit